MPPTSQPTRAATASPTHDPFMRHALALARRAWGRTHPNPMVGAVIVENGTIVAEGFHAQDGGPHAERVALAALGRRPKPGATLYVTMEPCSTQGRTGSCCEAIINAGISCVVAGATDPNPAHLGRGFDALRDAGIKVTTGILEADCADLNLIFNHNQRANGSPLIAVKSAMTLDGKIATRARQSQWITGAAARADVMRWRRLFPAIAVGASTVLADNPRLTARIEGEPEWCPWRFVFDGMLRSVMSRDFMPALYTDEFRERTIVVTTPHGGLGYVRKLRDMGVKVWCLESPTQRVLLPAFRRKCADDKITGVYIEGGAQLTGEFLRERQIDYLFAYTAPMLFADDKGKTAYTGLRTEQLAQAIRLADVRHASLGDDILIRGRAIYPEKLHVDESVFSLG